MRVVRSGLIVAAAAAVFFGNTVPAQAQTTAGTGTVIVVPVTAQTASFTSETTVRNPNGVPITVDVAFYEANNSLVPGLRPCADVVVPANRSVQFSLGTQCTLGPGSHFGLLVLTELSGTNPFYGYVRTQNPQGIGFSTEGFPAGNFNDQVSHSTGLKKTTTGLIFQTNCFVGSLAQPVSYTLKLFNDTSGAQIGSTIVGNLAAFQQFRYLDIFGPAGVNAPNVDQLNVRAEFTPTTTATLIGFCTVQDNTSFGADFRIAKSYGTPGTVTSITAGSGLSGGVITGAGTIDVDTAVIQSRVTGSCAPGSSIRAIAQNGTVTCETDDGGAANAFVQGGNAFGVPAILGITDNFDLDIRVNNQRVMRYRPNTISPNVIGGSPANSVATGVRGATIAGGGVPGGDTDPDFTSEFPNQVGDAYGTIGGGYANRAGDNAGTVIDRPFATVGGGFNNKADGGYSTVGGGGSNTASGLFSTVGGGDGNTASGLFSTVGGGDGNTASGTRSNVAGTSNTASGSFSAVSGGFANNASGIYSTVGGGLQSTASGSNSNVGGGELNSASGEWSTVVGGLLNRASGVGSIAGGIGSEARGNYSIALGYGAKTFSGANNGNGTFVFADSSNQLVDFTDGNDNRFSVRATGGVRLVTAIDGAGAPTAGVALTPGDSSWNVISDRSAKDNWRVVDGRDVLERLVAMPVARWNYKAQSAAVEHIGPSAQDFRAAFGLGHGDTTIATVDADGVALAAIQGLNAKLEAQVAEQRREISQLRAESATEIAKLRLAVEVLLARTSPGDQVTAAR